MNIANLIGSKVLPYTNPRVVCPPGLPAHNMRKNIVIATPMRSGTHVMIDLVLNNLVEYRAKPLYVDLDQCLRWPEASGFLEAIEPDAGQVIKTHLPTGPGAGKEHHPKFEELMDAALVITVHRDREKILASMARWGRTAAELEQISQDYDDFWAFWSSRVDIAVEFEDLFVAEKIGPVLDRAASLTHTRAVGKVLLPTTRSRTQRSRIYANKMLTRAFGPHAPRIDTTIHTLKV